MTANDVEALRERIHLLLDLSLHRKALAEVRRYPDWDRNPEALWQFGRIVHRFAPRSKDRSCAYSFARAMYRTAAGVAGNTVLRAEVLTDLGTSYFEEGRLDEAVVEYEASRSIAPWKYRVHLGLVAIACAMRDLGAIRQRCEAFRNDLPSWDANRDVVALLATDPDFAFLRAFTELFHECFGYHPVDVQALHDWYSLQALERALASFDAPEPAELTDVLELTKVVRGAWARIGPICSDGFSNSAIHPVGIQERIGF
jgi:hypothetical protein